MKIEEGYTLNYVIPGIAGIVLGLILLYANIINFDYTDRIIASDIGWIAVFFGGIFIIIGVLFLLVKTGVELNIEKREVRAYQSLFKYTIGEWRDVSYMHKAYLSINRGYYELMSRGGARTHRVQTVDLILIDSLQAKNKLYTFSSKKLAFKTLNLLQKHFNIEADKRIRSGKLKN